MSQRNVWVVGHCNPDTDSICAAIAYAELKNRIKGDDDTVYVPARAGELNEETKFVLAHFGVDAPDLISDVGSQVRDMEIRRTPGVKSGLSMNYAWDLMKKLRVATLPVTNEKRQLEGVIVTVDIAMCFLEELDSHLLSTARTQYKNIIETINGELITGNDHGYFVKGKVVIPTGSPEVVAESIEEDDLVILGNRKEALREALAENCSCMIVCNGTDVPEDIIRRAEERDVVLIRTEYDTFTVARLINQSIPIRFFMTRDHLITFDLDDYLSDVRQTMAKVRHRDFPVVDEEGCYVGMISRRNMIGAGKKQLILVDHNEKTQAVKGIEDAEILEIIDHHRIGSLETIQPVFFRNQPLGSTATIVAKMYQENGVTPDRATAGILLSAILSDTLMFRSPTCTKEDEKVAEALAQIAGVETEAFAREMFRAGSDFQRKSVEEIFYQDFKTFSVDETEFGVAQISAISMSILEPLRERLNLFLTKVLEEEHLSMVCVLLTDILAESSVVLYAGEEAEMILNAAFERDGAHAADGVVTLDGVVSRKKQFIPPIINALQKKDE